jgi:hypothetical protein
MMKKSYVVEGGDGYLYVFDQKPKAETFLEQDLEGDGEIKEALDYSNSRRTIQHIEKAVEEHDNRYREEVDSHEDVEADAE